MLGCLVIHATIFFVDDDIDTVTDLTVDDEKRISDTIRKELLCVNEFLTSFKRVVESNEDIKIFNVTLGSKNKLGNYNVPTSQNYLAAVIVGDMD